LRESSVVVLKVKGGSPANPTRERGQLRSKLELAPPPSFLPLLGGVTFLEALVVLKMFASMLIDVDRRGCGRAVVGSRDESDASMFRVGCG